MKITYGKESIDIQKERIVIICKNLEADVNHFNPQNCRVKNSVGNL